LARAVHSDLETLKTIALESRHSADGMT
jgi:hypothetical protein